MTGETDDSREGGTACVADVYVGSRIRLRRTMLGLSQDRLGKVLGLTFQQVQKYERGANRVGASRLFEISRALGVPVSYFFENMPAQRSQIPGIDDRLAKRETLELIRAYYRITAPAMRKQMLNLLRALASPEAGR